MSPIFSVTKEIRFCYGHRLLEYAGKCRFLHGHNGLLEVRIDKPELDSLGMVTDFSEISRLVKKWVDDELDHKLILHEADPMLETFRKFEQPFVTMPHNPTAENIARYVYEHCREQGLPVSEIGLWETDTSRAVYRG